MSDGRRGEREKRLAEALKANLKRRKEQRRERSSTVPSSDDERSEAAKPDRGPVSPRPDGPK